MEPRNEVTLVGVVKMEPVKKSSDKWTLTSFILNTDPERTQKAREEIRISCWNEFALAADDIATNDWVLVQGRLQERRFKARDGAWSSSWDVIANRVEIVTPKYANVLKETADRTGEDDEPFTGQF